MLSMLNELIKINIALENSRNLTINIFIIIYVKIISFDSLTNVLRVIVSISLKLICTKASIVTLFKINVGWV